MTASLTLVLGFILSTTGRGQPVDPFFMLLENNNQYAKKPGRCPSQHHQHLPVNDLIESSDKLYDPLPSDINATLLSKQLGLSEEPEFLSVRDPGKKKLSAVSILPLLRPSGHRPRFLNLLKSAVLQDGTRVRLKTSKKERRKFQKYLWSLTFCPVVYSWKYLGTRFWPHWIKEGNCLRKRSCSLPEGMMCNPSASMNVPLLRWFCLNYNDHNTCMWIRIQYPIIAKCSCSC